jgi:hypothetical protein
VVAYEKLIGERGTEISDSPQAAQATESENGISPQSANAGTSGKHPQVRREEHKELIKDPAGTSEIEKNHSE